MKNQATRKLEKNLTELDNFKPDAVAFSVISGSHLEYIKIAEDRIHKDC